MEQVACHPLYRFVELTVRMSLTLNPAPSRPRGQSLPLGVELAIQTVRD